MINPDKIKGCYLCGGLGPDELAEVAAIVSQKKLQKGEILFFEGDPATGFYVLLSGKMRVYKASPEGKEYTLHIIKTGQIFAEAAIFKGDHIPANAAAMEPSEVAFFPKAAFLDLLQKSPQISIKIIASLSSFVRDFNRQLEELSLKEVPARICAYLLDIYYQTGKVDIHLDISKTELANHLGTISETLSRNLRKLKELRAIDVERQKISLIDIPLLEEIADGKKI